MWKQASLGSAIDAAIQEKGAPGWAIACAGIVAPAPFVESRSRIILPSYHKLSRQFVFCTPCRPADEPRLQAHLRWYRRGHRRYTRLQRVRSVKVCPSRAGGGAEGRIAAARDFGHAGAPPRYRHTGTCPRGEGPAKSHQIDFSRCRNLATRPRCEKDHNRCACRSLHRCSGMATLDSRCSA